jgi:acylphosphatase
MNIRAKILVQGRVQGVNYRHHARLAALQHHVNGWVMNLPDGSVEGCFEGEEAGVEALIDWCRSGPDWADVEHVAVRKEEYRGEFDSFEIRR